MRNCGKLKLSFLYYSFAAKFCVLPSKLNTDSLTFEYTKGIRFWAWKIQYFLACLYGSIVFVRLMKLLLLEAEEINLIYISVHTAVGLMALLNIPYYRMFLGQKESNILLVSHLLKAVRRGVEDQPYGIKGYL